MTKVMQRALDDRQNWSPLTNLHILLVTSPTFVRNGAAQRVVSSASFASARIIDSVSPNPDIADIHRYQVECAGRPVEHIIALGGGSVIDTAKVLAKTLLMPHKSELTVGNIMATPGQVPLTIVPTTAGTGSEVTPFATLWDKRGNKKHSIFPVDARSVVHDASLLQSLNEQQILYPALDALSHGLESLWNKNRTEQSITFALAAIECLLLAMPKAIAGDRSLNVLAQLQRGAYLAGKAIAITKTALAHAISYPLTLQYGIPHGLACSFTLSAILQQRDICSQPTIRPIAKSVLALLHSLNLANEILRYVRPEQLLNEFNCELDPARAGNYIGHVNKDGIYSVLKQSVGV